MKGSLLLVDDHPWVIDAIAGLAKAVGWGPVHVAADLAQGRALAARHRPDLVSIDLAMGLEDGTDLLRELRRDHPHLTLVVLTAEVEPRRALECLVAGATAFIPKGTPPDEMMEAFDAAAAGHTWLPVSLIGSVLHAALHPPPASEWEELVSALSVREHEVLRLMVAGRDRQEISAALMISFNTVRTHFKNVLAKLGAHSSLEAVSIAVRAGVVPADEVEV